MTHFTIDFYLSGNLDALAPWVAEYGLNAPYGQCQCGCGQPAPIVKRNHIPKGWKKDHPLRFIQRHCIKERSLSLWSRFWQNVDKRGSNECWEWQGYRKTSGYGGFTIGDKSIFAHRISYEWHYGEIPNGLFVCHHCDNCPCVNPAHLFLGTQSDNMKDMYDKGRHPGHRGELNGQAKLNLAKAKEIRRRHAKGESGVALARAYGVGTSTISRVLNSKSWINDECRVAPSRGSL